MLNIFLALVVTTLVSNVCAQRFDGQVSDYQSKEGVIPGGISTTYEGDVDTSKIFSGSFQAGQPLSGEGPINIAVRRTHQVSTVPVNVPETEFVPQVIEVDAGELPIILKFNSRSSRVQVTQAHTGGGGGQVEQTSSEDEPTRLQHSVVKPIIQEVHEIITPFRRVIQEIRPVTEEVHTVVSRGPPPKVRPEAPKPKPPPSPTGKLGVSKGTGTKGPGVKGSGGGGSLAASAVASGIDGSAEDSSEEAGVASGSLAGSINKSGYRNGQRAYSVVSSRKK